MNRALSLLLSSKGLPVDDTIAALWGKKIYDANEWQITTLTGSLPLSFLSKGEALTDYLLHGSSEEAGAQTENLVAPEDVSFTISGVNFVFKNGQITISGTSTTDISSVNNNFKSNVFHLNAGSYYYRRFNKLPGAALALYKNIGTSTETIIPLGPSGEEKSFVLEQDADVFLGIYMVANTSANGTLLMSITPGSTPPDHYIPHGYQIPLTVTSEVTENIFDKDATDTSNGYVQGKYIAPGGSILSNSNWNISEYIEVDPNTVYTCAHVSAAEAAAGVGFYNANKAYISTSGSFNSNSVVTFTTRDNVKYARISFRTDHKDTAMLTKGSTAPDHYIPHRYTTTTPLYIGDSKLGAEEYVDYESGKVYKRTENLWDEKYPSIDSGSSATPRYKVLYVGDGDFTISTNLPKHAHYPSLALLGGSKTVGGMSDFSDTTWLDHPHTVASENGYITIAYRKNPYDPRNYWVMLNAGSTAESYAPYLNPTDPPVPLPAISTYQGENTLSSTETLGECSVTGRIKPIET
jgi:hypothetical protein